MGRYNPNSPYVLGNEFPPAVYQVGMLDTGSEIGYGMRMDSATSDVAVARLLAVSPPPGQPGTKSLAVNIYPAGCAPGTGPMRKLVIPCVSGTLGTGATLQGGAASVQAGVANPSQNGYVQLAGANASVRLWFDVTPTRVANILQYRRIIDVSVRYSLAGPFDTYGSGLVSLALERPAATAVWTMDTTLTGPAAQSLNNTWRSSRLGELNPFCLAATAPAAHTARLPWVYSPASATYQGLTALAASGGNNINVRFGTASDADGLTVGLYYCALEITYAQESRVAAGGLELSAGASGTSGIYSYLVPLTNPASYGFIPQLEQGSEYVVAVGLGHAGVASVSNPVPVPVSQVGTGGEPFPAHEGYVIRKTLRRGEPHTAELVDTMPAIDLHTSSTISLLTVIPDSQGYHTQAAGTVSSAVFLGDIQQEMPDTVAGSWRWVRFYARHAEGTTGALKVWQANAGLPVGPYAEITVDGFAELEEIANGWKQVTLELSSPIVTDASGTFSISWTSDADPGAPWQVLGGDANPYDSTFDAPSVATWAGGTGAFLDSYYDQSADLAVSIIQSMPQVAGLAVSVQTQALAPVDDGCGNLAPGVPSGLWYHRLTWTEYTDPAVVGFGYYEISRRDTTMPAGDWETVARIAAPWVTEMDDYEARVGVASAYRIRMVHVCGVASDWSPEAGVTLPAPGVVGLPAGTAGVVALTSNLNPGGNAAYAQWYDGGAPAQEFTFTEGEQTTFQQMYGRDYQVAFRPAERGGVEFERTLLVNSLGVPAETLSAGFRGLRDLAWAEVPYVCVRDELGNRWLTAVEVPSGAAQVVPARGHLMLAKAKFTEVAGTPAPVDYEAPCEGLRVEGQRRDVVWSATVPPVWNGTVTAADTFNRAAAADSWGSATPGGAWAVSGGTAPGDYDLNGTAATMSLGSVNVARRGVVGPTVKDVEILAAVTVPVVATGAAIQAGVLLRYQDANNSYRVMLAFNTGGTLTLSLVRRSAGTDTTLSSVAVSGAYAAGQKWWIGGRIRGLLLEGRAWRDGLFEQSFIDVGLRAYSSTITTAGQVGLYGNLAASNTNTLPVVLAWDSMTAKQVPMDFDLRFLLRPTDEQWRMTFGTSNPAGGGAGFALEVDEVAAALSVYGGGFASMSTPTAGLALDRYRKGWMRVAYTSDNGAGTSVATFYRSTDGAVWTSVATVTSGGANTAEPVDPLTPSALLQAGVRDGGGVTLLRAEVRLDGALIASPDWSAQAAGVSAFADGQAVAWSTLDGGLCVVT